MTVARYLDRHSAVEVMTLILTLTVRGSILIAGLVVAIIEVRDPAVDTSQTVQMIVNIVSAILGALLGLLAGKGDTAAAVAEMHQRPDGPDDAV